MVDLIANVNAVFGMGIELITILAIMGTVGVGDPLSLNPGFSIGGYTPKVANLLGNLGGLMGTPRGLDGAHNWIEADSSNTRDDLYVTGDSSTMNMTLFLQIANGADSEVITMQDIGKRAAERLAYSKTTNPYLYYGPYTGMIARNAGFAFSGRLLSNHTADHPDGYLTQGVLRSWEQIPSNWYRTPVDYGLVSLNVDLLAWMAEYPTLASIGGNTGTVNSFAGLDISDITGGVLNAESLLEGNNLMCFGLEVVKTFAPNSLSPLFAAIAVPLKLLLDVVNTSILDIAGCPDFGDMTMDGKPFFQGLQDTYPGAGKSGVSF
ncbi:oxidase protein [Rutstroemia sp. NJR-2017a BBW]|nr:oxidase protein [Rutstroemia sp. NJR-2017a BBW]